ncbi:hypothetical protein PLICRDRAFT_696369 [Plicaturopsis crispa FD-325 SS-3]|nr:hypothetical protein PLICRDRAFT_696369 [Plicaturopsis crispa FD-325 SS-3]
MTDSKLMNRTALADPDAVVNLPPGQTPPSSSLEKEQSVDAKDRAQDLAVEDDETYKLTNALFRRRRAIDRDATATRRSVYDDATLASHYWPKDDYENIHRFDPKARWTYREERALVRKIDWRVMLWAAISFSALGMDRSNILQANTDNFLDDINITTDDFNLGNTVFKIGFLCAELPSQLISKRLGPDRWVPTQMCLWSIVTMFQFFLTGRTSFLLCRALLGILQGGFIPDLILYLSYFYTKNELPFRLSMFWMSSNVCTIVSSFIALGVLRLRGVLGKAGWRWLFLIEGLITFVIGMLTYTQMPPSPTNTRAWYRPNGWFSEREETILVSRVLRDDPTKGDMHNREGLSLGRLWQAMCDYDLWPLYLIGLVFNIPTATPMTYLTLSLRNLGFSTFDTNLLNIPYLATGVVSMYAITLVSEQYNERSIISCMEDLLSLPFIIALYLLPDKPNKWVFFGVSTGLLTSPFTHPIQVGWCSRNAGGVASRTVNASLYNMFYQAGGILSAQVYMADDAPTYRRGNRILMIICCANVIILYPGTKAYYVWRNRQRARIWDAMTDEERVRYLTTTKDLGNRRLDFRFSH